MGKFLIFAIIFIFFIWGIKKVNQLVGDDLGKRRKCPYCRNYGLKSRSGGYYRNGQRGADWHCPHCNRDFFA